VLKRLLVARRVVVANSTSERSVADALAVVRSTSELLAVPVLIKVHPAHDDGVVVDVLAGGVLAGLVLE
jgi:hypothetical protein